VNSDLQGEPITGEEAGLPELFGVEFFAGCALIGFLARRDPIDARARATVANDAAQMAETLAARLRERPTELESIVDALATQFPFGQDPDTAKLTDLVARARMLKGGVP
jgi:hypothetical protein